MKENPEKMERPRPWPEPPEEEKLPELSIGCPACNDREHKVTIILFGSGSELILECDECGARYILKRCKIKELTEKHLHYGL